MIKNNCHDCGVEVGEIHEYGCDMEYCPFCLGQLISCRCKGKQLDNLEREGRIPYFVIPHLCRMCGEKWPEMFTVSDKEWESTIPKNLWWEVICKECYEEIKEITSHRQD
jgi:hypothetical protein